MKFFMSILSVIVLAASLYSCQSAEAHDVKQISSNPTNFDWSNDPLVVKIDYDNLQSDLDIDELEDIVADLYNYFHLQQTGDSADFHAHFHYFPKYYDNDTVFKPMLYTQTKSWWDKGYRNSVKEINVNFASEWIDENSQKVALVGFDIIYSLEFSEIFQGTPSSFELFIKNKMPDADVRYEEEYVTGANGKRELIRRVVADGNSGVFVFSDIDKFDPRFMSLDIGKNPDTNKLLKWDTKIELLRAKKEADDK